jgi:hypothetical protein
VHFKIRNCVLTEAFRSLLYERLQEKDYLGGADHGDIKIFGFDVHTLNVELYGPFHSSDLHIRNAKKMAILTSGIGGTVAYSAIAFARYRPGHWDELTVFHFDKQSDYSAESLKVNEGRMCVPIHCTSFEDVVNFATRRNASSNKTVSKENDTNKAAIIQQVRPTFVSLEGRLTAQFTAELLQELHNRGYEFMICSRVWTQMIEVANAIQPFHGGLLKALHIEEFS